MSLFCERPKNRIDDVVQFRYAADSSPLELDRLAFNQRVHVLVLHVEQLLG